MSTTVKAPAGFSWVNYTRASIIEKDKEDLSIIRSHATRVVHRERQKCLTRRQGRSKKPKIMTPRPREDSAEALVQQCDPFLYEPGTDWEGLAIGQFTEDFIYAPLPTDTSYQYLTFLPRLWNKYSDRSCLSEAILAVALASFANQNLASGLEFQARKAYATALKLVNAAMKDPELQKSDQVLATLCLLTKYEIVSGDAVDSDSWQAHERGQAALIYQRGHEQLGTVVGAALFRLIFTRQCLNCIAQAQLPAIASSFSWQSAWAWDPAPHLEKTMELFLRIASLRYSARVNSASDSPVYSPEACRIAQAAVSLNIELASCMNDVPQELMNTTVSRDWYPRNARDSYSPQHIIIFRNSQQASFYHIIWFGQLHVLQTLLRYSRYQLEYEPEELQTRSQDIIDRICESVPYALSDADCPKTWKNSEGGREVAGHYLIWALAAASTVPGVPKAQKEWICQRLKHIGFAHGMR